MPMADPVDPNRQPLITDPERELPEHATPSHLGRIPGPATNPRLNGAAESVGSALGTAVSSVRHLPSTLQDAKARFTVIRGRKQRDVQEAAGQTVNRIREASVKVKDEAIGRIREASATVKDQAREGLEQARTRADNLAYDYPLEFIAGAATFGMLLGMGLRIWRDHAS